MIIDHWIDEKVNLTIYAPTIYTAPCIKFLMRADPLRGEVGGGGEVGAGNREFFGPLEMGEIWGVEYVSKSAPTPFKVFPQICDKAPEIELLWQGGGEELVQSPC